MYYEIKWEETPFLARPWRAFFLFSLVGFWVCLTVRHLLYVWSWRCGGDRWAALGLPVLGPQPSDSSRWTPLPHPMPPAITARPFPGRQLPVGVCPCRHPCCSCWTGLPCSSGTQQGSSPAPRRAPCVAVSTGCLLLVPFLTCGCPGLHCSLWPPQWKHNLCVAEGPATWSWGS